jgi:hypothetical protein
MHSLFNRWPYVDNVINGMKTRSNILVARIEYSRRLNVMRDTAALRRGKQ